MMHYVRVDHIENFDDIDYIKFKTTVGYAKHDTPALRGCAVPFVSSYGTGTISWSKTDTHCYVYLYFDDFSNLGQTGSKDLVINYDYDAFDNFYINGRGNPSGGDSDFRCYFKDGSICTGEHTVYYGSLWRNLVECTDQGLEVTEISLTREPYSSTSDAKIWTDADGKDWDGMDGVAVDPTLIMVGFSRHF